MEDDAYGELWFDKEPPPSMFSLSDGQHAIKVCTFSKIIATGLRMGWILAPESLISRTAAVRYDMGTSPFQGRVIAEMINNGDLERHIDRLRAIYRKKLERVEDSLARYCGEYCTYVRPEGGFFLWLLLRPGIPYAEVQQVAMNRGVVVGGGPQFHADGSTTNHLRLAFSYVAMEDIEQGIHLLGEAMQEVASAVGVK
jgi:DNA-binding transcriptional MocR family regulator